MSQTFDVNSLKIAKPCSASWAEMKGDDQRRFCGSCKKNVYNVAGMTEKEVKDLISKSELLPCLRLARRADGTIVTRDCPVGVARFWQKAALAGLGVVAFGFTMAGAIKGGYQKRYEGETLTDVLRDKPIVGPIIDKVDPPQQFLAGEIAPPVMGKVVCPPTKP